MAVPSTGETAPIIVPPLKPEEEDDIIHTRITNDERPLRRLIKKFHNYVSAVHPSAAHLDDNSPSSVEDARDAFLIELASFQLTLKKSAMICEAEARQVEEYQRERQRIEDEHGNLQGQIEQLKTALEHSQMIRRRKIEYDLVAEKVNTLPSREELEQSIQSLENDIAAIRAEHDTQNQMIQGQKTSLDNIISDLGSLRFTGKDRETTSSVMASPQMTPLPDIIDDGNIDISEGAGSLTRQQTEEKEDVTEDDIEMGEVAEEPKDKGKKKIREELEEGEASDTSSALSDPPDD